jgi:hypothetical protein
VVAFAVATPPLAALPLVHRQAFRHRASRSRVVDGATAVAQVSAFVGIAAAFCVVTRHRVAWTCRRSLRTGLHHSGPRV